MFEPTAYLKDIAVTADEDIDLASGALALAALEHPGISLGAYIHHLKMLVADVEARHRELLSEGHEDTAHLRLEALQAVIFDTEGYRGDTETYDDLQNADLIRVIDRRKGLPVALAILCIHSGRACGWEIFALDIPGHVLCRLDHNGHRIIFDPFDRGREVAARDIRALVKNALGPDAEISATYLEPSPNRMILLRLQNNIKFRQIAVEDYEAALKTAETMRVFAPDEPRLLLDEGILNMRTGRLKAAVTTLEEYVRVIKDPAERREAMLILDELRGQVQ